MTLLQGGGPRRTMFAGRMLLRPPGFILHLRLRPSQHGGAVQVETRIESACLQRLKVKHDNLLSSFAFKFNLRPCNMVASCALSGVESATTMVGWCKLTLVESRVDSACFQRLKLKYDTPLSSFAFNFNLRPSTLAVMLPFSRVMEHEAGRGKLKPVFESARSQNLELKYDRRH